MGWSNVVTISPAIFERYAARASSAVPGFCGPLKGLSGSGVSKGWFVCWAKPMWKDMAAVAADAAAGVVGAVAVFLDNFVPT